jgi:ABC-type branched-subunit amino acid transport system permease subunit
MTALETMIAVGLGGFGLGLGLVVGAFVVRALRRYMTENGFRPYDREDRHGE